jgi:hypothetical protein
MSDDTRQLDYAAPENDPPNVDGLLRAAYWLNWIGVIVPLAGLGGAAWAGFALVQPFITKDDKETAQRLLVAGVVATIINSAVLISFVLSFAYKVSPRGY